MKITVLSVKPDAAARKRPFRFADNGDGVKIAEIRNKERSFFLNTDMERRILPFLWVHGESEDVYREMVKAIYDAKS